MSVGEYEIAPSMRPSEIVQMIAEGRTATIVLTVPEGRRLGEVADVVAERGGLNITRDQFVAALRPDAYPHDFLKGPGAPVSLEGYLYPDTYRLRRTATANEIVTLMLDAFGARVPPADRARAAEVGLTFHEVVTLAAIVEREAVKADERPRIAGVYLNRLRDGMRLQADPTVQFALLGPNVSIVPPAGKYWKTDLTVADLQTDSRYNTYRYAGLPPGPICNPGLPAIAAVLDPEEHEYYYFVARPDGSHAFGRTLAEHNANVARYQR